LTSRRSKIHHYVPKGLQRYFCVVGEKIWYAERRPDGKFVEPELRNIHSVFQIKNYYTILEGAKPSDKIERQYYGVLDNFLGDFLLHVHETLDKKMLPVIKGRPLESLRRCIFQMITRGPEFLQNYNETDVGHQIVVDTLATVKARNDADPQIYELQEKLLHPDRLRQLGRHSRVLGQMSRSERVENALDEFFPKWAVSEGSHSFVISSRAVHRIGNGGSNGLANPVVEYWLPISPKRALVLLRKSDQTIPDLYSISRDHMRHINEFAAKDSKSLASHSETLLRSLIAG
jgi:Protein of unknown function (DUF4238)